MVVEGDVGAIVLQCIVGVEGGVAVIVLQCIVGVEGGRLQPRYCSVYCGCGGG